MTKQDVPVEAGTAQSLAAQASKKGKTLSSLTNEILDVALRIYREGGNADEIFPAWKASRMSKDFEGAPFVPSGLIRKIVERLYPKDREWLLQEWVTAGKELGDHLRLSYPTLEDLRAGMSVINLLIEQQRFEVTRTSVANGRAEIRLRVTTGLTPELAACGERLLVGVLSSYAFQTVKSHVADGIIEITAVYVGAPP